MTLVLIPEITSVPSFKQLTADMRASMWQADAALASLPATSVDVWLALLSNGQKAIETEDFAPFAPFFADPLTETYRTYHDLAVEEAVTETISHSTEQMRHLPAYSSDLAEQIQRRDFGAFLAGLQGLSSAFLERPSTFRDCSVYLARDIRGAYVEFPPHTTVTAQLSLCFDALCDDTSAALHRAVIAYVTIIGAHPFYDGNGRVARLLFNAILVSAGLAPESFIPIKEVHRISRGAVSVRLRRALIKGAWNGIFESLTHAVFLAAYINGRRA
jgi:hypothetical protein